MKVPEVFELMVAETKKKSLPRFYKEDVTIHDLNTLTDLFEHECGKFLWVIRECGSWIWTEKEHLARPNQSSGFLGAWKTIEGAKVYYYFDGETLKEIAEKELKTDLFTPDEW